MSLKLLSIWKHKNAVFPYKKIELDSIYKVVTNSFLAGGDDEYVMLKDIP